MAKRKRRSRSLPPLPKSRYLAVNHSGVWYVYDWWKNEMIRADDQGMAIEMAANMEGIRRIASKG